MNEHWNFLNQHIVKILENKQSWSTYVIYLFSENYKLLNENSDKFLSLFNQPQNVNNPQNNNIQNTQITLDKPNDNSNLIGVETRQVEPENECKICFDGEINTVIVNCGHQVMCEKCSIDLPLKECPVCRSPIGDKGIIKVYKS